MITADPTKRAHLLDEIQRLVTEAAPEGDRELLREFATVVTGELPDAVIFRLPPAALAARIEEYFRFIARTMPPDVQLYRGLPGLHVSVRNADEAEDRAMAGHDGGPHEVTIVETHTPDAPFIFESLTNFFKNEGLRVFSAVHPRLTVRRQWERVVHVGTLADEGSRELFCQFRIERVDRTDRMRRLEHQIFSLLKSVFLAVEDFAAMKASLQAAGGRLRAREGREAVESVDAARALLQWICDDNFVLLGVMRYVPGADGHLQPQDDSALGAFKDRSLLETVFPGLPADIARNVAPAPDDARILDIDYCVDGRAIHHRGPLEDIFIREWNADGSLAGMTLAIGRFAKSAFATRAADIPVLHDKLAYVLANLDVAKNSHAWREARASFNYFPKRELLYARREDLRAIIQQMVNLVGDDEIAVSARQGSGYAAVTVAFSDVRYSPSVEAALGAALQQAFGRILFSEWADLGTTAVIVFYFDASALESPIDTDTVRALTRQVVTTWEDHVAQRLEEAHGTIEGRRLFDKYIRTDTRSGLYRVSTAPGEVPADLARLEALEGRLEMHVLPESSDHATIKLYAPKPLGLSDTLRTLAHLGLPVVEELALPLVLPDNRTGFLERLRVHASPNIIAAVLGAPERLLDALRALHERRATDDALNGLVTSEGLTWRQVEVLRTLRNHLIQVRPSYNADTITSVLLRNSAAAAALLRLFDARFNPVLDGDRDQAVDHADRALRRALQQVGSLLDDEILRGVENLLLAVVRTNAYQKPERPVCSMKVECAKVAGMVSPRPLFEIYVHSPHLEGIHLRGGRVARGGLRWSDRHDDFRTEVLGLMKTQMAKNSIIVPVGSKGGFVLKGVLPARPALDQYLVDRYRQFIAGLLDVTDNIVDGAVVHPPDVVRYDMPDPYLVVAADKGTAHLSDTANAVSAQYGFWLGDAFASGGSHGYDHKVEGITARGAWECVRHHFRNLGRDIQVEPFTMAGIGDMSGDVFGNGSLRSRVTRLVAAFNHQHIFLDPDPDMERSFVERERLFKLPRSTWRDYDASIISEGGGIFDRSAKAIPVSPQVKALLDIDADEVTGEEMIRRILTSRVDLLYNGGIGTYVKASAEDDSQVGDRANDRVRVDACEVRALVVGEGGNLGLTQKARIEYWDRGGLCNTDAIDNSGGVDMSDHEVNIKILLDILVREKVIASKDDRNVVLKEMTDNVSELVLDDNRNQARALSLDGVRSVVEYDAFVDAIDQMIVNRVFSREDHDVPTRDALLSSPQRLRGLPRPLLAVVLAQAKMQAYDITLASSVPDSDAGLPLLTRYFPDLMQARYADAFTKHPLKREIVATVAINHVINHAGITFLPAVAAQTGSAYGPIVQAYIEADAASDASGRRAAILAANGGAESERRELLAIEAELEAAVVSRLS
ncbi:MAG: NAD-glutamate dehydrogenase [Acidobacteria bacterium]|nr:NAD-glutamate dehydrogenase [Acidobacteriota bacterium]